MRREGVVIRLATESGRAGFGEAAPVPGFSAESVEAIAARLRGNGEAFSVTDLSEITRGTPALRWALENALARPVAPALREIEVAGLLPAGEAAIEAIERERANGKRVFKWKIGVASVDQEIAWAENLAAALPGGAKLRLDANGGLGEAFPEWLAWCAGRRELIDYLEQPLAPGDEAAMMALAAAANVPIALDESVAGVDQLIDRAAACPAAILIVKPSLLGSLRRFVEWRQAHPDRRVIYSSCFETAVGYRAAWALAASDPRPEPAGFGVLEFLEADGLSPVTAGSRLGAGDFPESVEEAVWKRL